MAGGLLGCFQQSKLARTAEIAAGRAKAPAFPLPQPDWLKNGSKDAIARMEKDQASKFAALAHKVSPAARDDLERLLDSGKLDDRDATGRSTLDYLYATVATDLSPAAKADGVTNEGLASSLVSTLARPDDIGQETAVDCVWTNITRDLAKESPVDFVKFNLGLYVRGGANLPGVDVHAHLAEEGVMLGDRLASDAQLLGSLEEFFPNKNTYGLPNEFARNMAGSYLGLYGGGTQVVLDNGEGGGHLVTVDNVSGNSLSYYDPARPGGTLTRNVAEFMQDAIAILLPKDVRVPLSDVEAADVREIGGGRLGAGRGRGRG